ncbi:hypothetical protein Scep_010232 [Stephania cephalantha]|uniref:Uncharacterized protein n=1 Tax=Stephania cephalantha TaxID=152367 RepID=A0AAP0JV26_9MAGN
MDRLKLGALGERLKSGGAQMSRMVSGKMKEILQSASPESKMVDSATDETLEEANWGLNLRICGMLNSGEFSGQEVVRAIKRKISGKSAASQRLSLDLLETCAMNCEKVFSEIASEKVLDEMVRMIDGPETEQNVRERALQLIRAWGELEDLAYLPVFAQTYKSLKTRTIPSSMQDNVPSVLSYLGTSANGEPLSPPSSYPVPNPDAGNVDDADTFYYTSSGGVEEQKEFLVVTRNSVELLSSMLSKAEAGSLKDELTVTMLEKCNDAQPGLQRIIQNTREDEAMLFEALNLNDELQQVISKYQEMKASTRAEEQSPKASEESGVVSTQTVQAAVGEAESTSSAKRDSSDISTGGESSPLGLHVQMGGDNTMAPAGESNKMGRDGVIPSGLGQQKEKGGDSTMASLGERTEK